MNDVILYFQSTHEKIFIERYFMPQDFAYEFLGCFTLKVINDDDLIEIKCN